MNTNMNCDICCNKVSPKQLITCIHCSSKACKKCLKIYILNKNNEIPTCMYCRKEWSDDFLYENFGRSFMNTSLKQIQKKIILKNEKRYIDNTQTQLLLYIEKKKKESKLKTLIDIKKKKKKELDIISIEIQKNTRRYF